MAEWDEFSERLRDVETREVHDAGAGAPVHNAAEGTQYWDATNDDLYINDDGAAGWQLVGGGGGGVPHNLLDGVVHPDTVLQGVSRGSIVYGDPTPLWNELVHPGAANRILQSAALDVQWSANTLTLTANLTNLGGAANQVAYWSALDTLSGENQLALSRGGTAADLSATGGAGQYVKQAGVGAAFTVGTIPAGDLPNLGGVPALTYTTVNAGGVAATYVRTDASLAIFDVNVPTTIQADDAAAAGAAAFAARRDHVHGFPTVAPVNIGVANVEGTAYDFVRSDHVHAHPAGLGVNLHHNEVHIVNSTGPHAEAGLTVGHVLRVTGAAAFSFQALVATDLPAHNLLSAQHGDTVVQAVSRGSLVYGDVTPDWNELVHPAAANRVLQTTAADVQWSAQALTLTTALTNQGAAGVLNWGGAFTLTIPATGTAALGTGAANRVAYWSGVNTLTSDAGLTVDAANDFYLVADAGGIGNSAATARLVFDSSGVNYANFANCIVFINETANANMTIGLTIDQGAADDEILNLRSSDVGAVHNSVETNTYGMIRKTGGAVGGLRIGGLKDAGGSSYGAAQFLGYLARAPDTAKSTAGRAIVESWGHQTDGTNVVNTVADGNVWALRTHRGGADVTLAIVDEDGDLWLGGGMTLSLGTNQEYLFTNRTTTLLAIQSQTAGLNSELGLYAADGDATDYVSLVVYGFGIPAVTANRERLQMQWRPDISAFSINTEAQGTGTLRPLVLFTEGNANQLYLATDGKVGFNTPPDRRLHARETSASTNVIIPGARFESEVSGGVGAAGHGAGVEFYGESSTTTNQGMGELAFRWDTATHASRRSRFELYTWYIGNDVLSGVLVNAGYASADGNARGTGAVDWQNYRTAVTQVASGAQAVLCGGALNTAAGGNSAVCGGYSGDITAPALSAFIGAGLNDQVSGAYAATLAGRENTVSGTYAAALGGYYCLADKRGQIASATGRFAAQGDAQGTIQIVARRFVTTHVVNTWYELYLDGAAAGLHVIAASSAWTIHALVVGINFRASAQWGYELTGLLERDNAGNTTLASYTLRTIFESDANYEARLAADNVNEALKVEIRRTGGADSNIRWVATIRTAEVSYS